MTPPAAAKLCVRCGVDCSNRPRVKDAQGRYVCRVCLDAKAAPAPIPVADDALPIGLVEEPAAAPAGPQICPSCGSSIPHGGAICVQCGFDVRKGAKLGTDRGQPQEQSPIPPKNGKCGKCGYSIKGLKEPRCPECGTVIGRMSDRERRRRDNAQTVKWSYLKPLIQIAAGVGGGALLCLVKGEPVDALRYAVTYAVLLPFTEIVFVACCFLWLGFDSTLHLILLRIAGVQALVCLVATVADFLPFGYLVGGVIKLIAYIGILSESMELDFQDAVLVGIATCGVQLIMMIMIVAYLVAHL